MPYQMHVVFFFFTFWKIALAFPKANASFLQREFSMLSITCNSLFHILVYQRSNNVWYYISS